MQLFNKALTLAVLSVAASAITVTYDPGYDDATRSMYWVACSDGPMGLVTRYGWYSQGELPRFPYVGGASVVSGWGSAECGTCWRLTYGTNSITILAIDHADHGFNIGVHAMNDLTYGQAAALGTIEVTADRASEADCGLSAWGPQAPPSPTHAFTS